MSMKRPINSDATGDRKRMKSDDKENQPPVIFEEDDDDDDLPSIVTRVQEVGDPHPTSKQYYVYEKTVPTVISRTARTWTLKYRRVMDHVDPDGYNMYIHNDFVCYGELEVIENCLLDMEKDFFKEKKVTLPRAIQAFRRWEALILLLNYASAYTGIDDGQRFAQLLRLIGACTVTILRNLLPKSMFESNDAPQEISSADLQQLKKISQQLVNWKDILEQALIVSENLLSIGQSHTAYVNILQTVYCNWLWIMEKSSVDTSTPETVRDAVLRGQQMKKTSFNESFHFLRELEQYRKNYPDLGGDAHDLRKWPRVRRLLFSNANHNDDDSDDDDDLINFWFRM